MFITFPQSRLLLSLSTFASFFLAASAAEPAPNPEPAEMKPVPAVADEDSVVQKSPEEMASEIGATLPPYPWHLANIRWKYVAPVENFESLSQTVTIDRDIPEDYNLYISPIGAAQINKMMFYGGIQSNVNGWADPLKKERVHIGRGGIFSRWSHDKTTPLSLEYVKTAGPDCLVETAGYEGEFASVRRPIKWGKGTWTYEIRKAETEQIDGKPHTWFECRVKNPAGEWTSVGKLRFEGEKFTLDPLHPNFVEVYATAKIPRSGIPKVNVRFEWPMVNGQAAKVSNVTAYYPDKNIQASPDCALIKGDGSAVLVEVGPIFKRDEAQRHHTVEVTPPAS